MFKGIEQHLRKRVDDVVFIEIKKETKIQIKDYVIKSDIPLPILLKDFVEKVKGKDEKDIPITSIISGIIYILGIDPEFKYKNEYIEILEAFSDTPLHYILGMGFNEINKEDFINGLICFRSALVLDEDSLDALYNYGRCCEDIASRNEGKKLEKAFIEESFEVYEYISEKYPESHLGFYHLGFCYANQKSYGLAEKAWNIALEKDIDENKHMEILEKIIELRDKVVYEKGYELVLNGRYQEGLEMLLSIEEQYEDWWNLLFFIGLAYRNLENFEEAIKYYKKVLVHHPRHPETHNELGLTYMMMGLTSDAEEYFVEGVRINPESHEMLCNLAMIHMEREQYETAQDFLDKAYEIDPNDDITIKCLEHLNKIREKK